jgi:hypothetical protein
MEIHLLFAEKQLASKGGHGFSLPALSSHKSLQLDQ